MKPLLIVFASIYFVSCYSTKYYSYKAELTYPVQSNELHYDNDTFSITFSLETEGIGIDIYNKSEEAIRINWDEVSIASNGDAKRVVHKETGVIHRNELQPPTTIPPKSKLNDILIPSAAVSYSGGTTIIAKTFPRNTNSKLSKDDVLNYKGRRLVVSLPFYMRGVYVSKYYNITITDVELSKNKT